MHHPDAQHVNLYSTLPFNPVFILGQHRSGTSILYKILASTNQFNILTAYHILNYPQLVDSYINKQETHQKKNLAILLKKHVGADRGIDRLAVTPNFPEEYGFILGQHSSNMNINKHNIDIFTTLCQKLQYLAQNSKPLLLKNPHDFNNFMYIKRNFPTAKFIFIHRHPLHIMSSLIKAVTQLFQQKNWYTEHLWRFYQIIFRNPLLQYSIKILTKHLIIFLIIYLSVQMHNATKYYLKNINKLSKKDYIEITYEKLCSEPNKTIQNIFSFLSIPSQEKSDFSSMIQPRNPPIESHVQALQNFIYKTNKSYYQHFHFIPLK